MIYDYENTIDFARQEERICVAKNLLAMGLSFEQIAQATNLTVKQVAELMMSEQANG